MHFELKWLNLFLTSDIEQTDHRLETSLATSQHETASRCLVFQKSIKSLQHAHVTFRFQFITTGTKLRNNCSNKYHNELNNEKDGFN